MRNGDTLLSGEALRVSGEASDGAGGNAQHDALDDVAGEEIGRVDVCKTPNSTVAPQGREARRNQLLTKHLPTSLSAEPVRRSAAAPAFFFRGAHR
jgi:hypothetical protein